jgi:hypothetical protein
MNLAKLEIQKKDMLYIVATVIILAVVFILGYRQLNPAEGASAGVTVEVVQPIGSSFNSAALDHIRDEEKSKNFVVPIDLGTGVGTTTPFGQL